MFSEFKRLMVTDYTAIQKVTSRR